MLSSVGHLLAPLRCVACGRRATPPWCDACRALARPALPGCRRCADPWPGHRCPVLGTAVVRTVARWRYAGPVRAAVAGAKARGAWAGWDRLGDDLADVVVATARREEWDVAAVTWVPGRPRVVRSRGLDHARVLAECVARGLGVTAVSALVAEPGAGRRVDAAGRRRPAEDAWFSPRLRAPAVGGLVLVDDVLTTGATVRAAAQALALGARPAPRVHVAVLARSGAASGAIVPGGPV